MAAVLYLGAVLIWLGGFIGGFICISNRYIDNSFLIALIIWLGAFFEGALIFAVARIYQATVDSHEKENPETESYEEETMAPTEEKNVPAPPQIDTCARHYGDSAKAFSEAYKAHYNHKNYKDAYLLYTGIIQDYPESKEARYAKQQIENIEKTVDLSAMLLDQ